MCFWRLPFVLGFCHSIIVILKCASVDFLGKMLATMVVVGQALLVPLPLHGLAGFMSKAEAWHVPRVLPLWWFPHFWCTWTPDAGYPGASGICAPCSSGIAWAGIVKSKAVAWHALRVWLLWWFPIFSKAVAWYALRVLPLWWSPNFWLFQDSQCWLPWWKWDTRSVIHWHCMG